MLDPEQILKLPGIIELFGEAGAGKSQLCHFLTAYYVSINRSKKVLYIALDGIYRSERFFNYLGLSSDNEKLSFGKLVLVHHEFDSDTLHKFMLNSLDSACKRHDIGLIIIDSLAAAFRLHEHSDDKIMLFDIMKSLRKAFICYNCHVIITNQVSAKFAQDIEEIDSEGHILALKPALGLQWSNCVDHRFLVKKDISGKSTSCIPTRSSLIPVCGLFNLDFAQKATLQELTAPP